MTRLTRLLTVATMLQGRSLLTAAVVAERFGVSLRTVYRDMQQLREAGIPVRVEAGRGYSLATDFVLRPPGLTATETAALLTAEKLMARDSDESLVRAHASAMEKIHTVLPWQERVPARELRDRIAVLHNLSGARSSRYASVVHSAIRERRVLRFTYHSLGKGEVTVREVEPLAIYQSKTNWVLIGFCRFRLAEREFRLDRIRDLVATAQRYGARDFELVSYFLGNSPTAPAPLTAPCQSAESALHQQTKQLMQTVQRPRLRIVGIAVRTSNQNGDSARDIPALWQRFTAEDIASQIPHASGQEVYCIYTDYTGDHTAPYTCVLGLAVSAVHELPAGLQAVTLAEGAYAKHVARGNLNEGAVFRAWNHIWAAELDRAYVADYEVYGAAARNPEAAEVEIFVGVR